MATLSQLRSRVYLKIGLDDTASGEEETAVTGWLNDAVLEFLLDTHCFIGVAPAALTAGEGDYELDSDVLAVTRIIDSGNIPLERVTVSEIDELRRNSVSASSYRRKYALNGANMLMIWPEPSSAETLNIYHVPRPSPMSDGSHDPSSSTYGGIPSEYHKALEFYACWQAADYDDDGSSAQGDRYLGQYQMQTNRCKARIVRKGGKISPLRLRAGRLRVPHDPSQDIW